MNTSTNKARAFSLIKRNGSVEPFEPSKIRAAIQKAYLFDGDGQPTRPDNKLSQSEYETIEKVLDQVLTALFRNNDGRAHIHIEDVQDQVELQLMRSGDHKVARGYVIYRERHQKQRAASVTLVAANDEPHLQLRDAHGQMIRLSQTDVQRLIESYAGDLPNVAPAAVAERAVKDGYPGMPVDEFNKALIFAARERIETEPEYSQLAARMLNRTLMEEALGFMPSAAEIKEAHTAYFPKYVKQAIDAELLNPEFVKRFDLSALAQTLRPERDGQFRYLGLQTLYDRYFLHIEERRIELPQIFFMRIAMGIALNEQNPTERAMEFYDIMSRFDYVPSTPTLFNAGSLRSQLSSCYLTTIADDLDGIYEGIKDNALLSKYAGGLGNDWTQVRALGAYIKGTNGKSQGVVPFLKVANDTAVAVNQGGRRKGAVCAYLETWHLDIEEFLELRKNTGDDRRRTHDMNTANWIPDLFVKRVMEDGEWTLFSPNEVPDLHDLYGRAFNERYAFYEKQATLGQLRTYKTVKAKDLWRKMLSMLFETGHPWITFKDACNVRSPQRHVGVVHSSNLCTEITLNTSADEIAVCNLGSVNLLNHLTKTEAGYEIDHEKLRSTVKTAMRMLDNVIDINYYPVKKAETANMKHRPVGLGVMAFQDVLHAMRIPYASEKAVDMADQLQEAVCYYAYDASSDLAVERGKYSSYEGSLWQQGILPPDSLKLLADERGQAIDTLAKAGRLDWNRLRDKIKSNGMRNSNCVAIAPTATISNIIGVTASIEPTFQNLYVKSNLSGEFTVVNEFLVRDLKSVGLWDSAMVADLKHFDGSLEKIERIPGELKRLYATAFEVDPVWLVQAAAYRQKWIDQALSLNIYMAGASGRVLNETYLSAWALGCKTTYYLRTRSASSVEKSTGRGGELSAVQSQVEEPKFCSLDDAECTSCQ